MALRKSLLIKEVVEAEAGSPAPRPVSRAAAIAIIDNPFAGKFVEDLAAPVRGEAGTLRPDDPDSCA